MPQTIYLIRHGETTTNQQDIMAGHLDVPLTQVGHEQAQKLSALLHGIHFDTLITSDLISTQQTAAPLAKLAGHMPVAYSELKERGQGPFEGVSWQDILDRYPDFVNQAYRQETNTLGVESTAALKTRIKKAFKHIHQDHAGQTVAIFTHGGLKRILIWHLTGQPVSDDLRFTNTSVTILEKNSGHNYTVTQLADTSHL